MLSLEVKRSSVVQEICTIYIFGLYGHLLVRSSFEHKNTTCMQRFRYVLSPFAKKIHTVTLKKFVVDLLTIILKAN